MIYIPNVWLKSCPKQLYFLVQSKYFLSKASSLARLFIRDFNDAILTIISVATLMIWDKKARVKSTHEIQLLKEQSKYSVSYIGNRYKKHFEFIIFAIIYVYIFIRKRRKFYSNISISYIYTQPIFIKITGI